MPEDRRQHDTGWDRLDERTVAMEKRIARLEIAIIAVLVSGVGVVVKFVLGNSGLIK